MSADALHLAMIVGIASGAVIAATLLLAIVDFISPRTVDRLLIWLDGLTR